MQLFYAPNIDDQLLQLEKEESRHLIQVLRKSVGDRIWFTDGAGKKCLFEIMDAHPKKSLLSKKEEEFHPLASPQLSIGIAPTKNMDRLEWFLEKCTEIGIHEIFLFTSTQSERKTVKTERLQKIVVAAMKQSLRYHLPIIHPLESFSDLLKRDHHATKYICHLEEDQVSFLHDELQAGEDALMLIGPEGDFTPEEVSEAKEKGFKAVALGNARLRTETAGVVACQTFNQINLIPKS